MSAKRPLRIGIMLRALDEKGGVGVYTHNVLRELLAIDRRNHYVLFYRTAGNLGRYAELDNVTERLVRAPGKALWDQVAIPWACWREKVDLVFHPKFTVPLLAPCKAVMVVHGADWFIPEQAQFYKPLDVRYIRTVMPWYFRKAACVLSVSQLTTDNFYDVLDLPSGKVVTVYFGPAKHFEPVDDPARLAEVRAKYRLPERFFLTLSKIGDGNRKNFSNIAEAYRLYHEGAEAPLPLVVGGKDCHTHRQTYGIPEDGWGSGLVFPGWIDQADLPAIYSMAELYLYTSNLEAFPIPITEAMACGTPIITSNVNGLEEIAGDAALLVDPTRPQEIADAVARVLADEESRRALSQRGLRRSTRFTWEKCGRETLRILESLAG
jgi:glycosyltransferase involved in cell wall biosynthesis